MSITSRVEAIFLKHQDRPITSLLSCPIPRPLAVPRTKYKSILILGGFLLNFFTLGVYLDSLVGNLLYKARTLPPGTSSLFIIPQIAL